MPGALRRTWASLRRLLDERTPRGRAASYLLAVLAIVTAVWALYTFFPRRPDPTVELALPLPAGGVGTLAEIRVWPDMPLLVSGEHHTDLSTVDLQLADRRLARVPVDGEGRFRAEVRIPRTLAPGTYAFVSRDQGSGNVTAREQLVVEDPGEPALAMQPDAVAAGGRIAVTGGGFPARVVLNLLLDADGGAPRTLGRVRTRPNGLIFARVAIPADVPEGTHEVSTVTRAGAVLGRPGRFEVTAD